MFFFYFRSRRCIDRHDYQALGICGKILEFAFYHQWWTYWNGMANKTPGCSQRSLLGGFPGRRGLTPPTNVSILWLLAYLHISYFALFISQHSSVYSVLPFVNQTGCVAKGKYRQGARVRHAHPSPHTPLPLPPLPSQSRATNSEF